MSETTSYPYETRLNIHCQQGEVIGQRPLADACAYKWYNQTLCQVNESVVRLGVVQGEYRGHKHDDDDESFYLVEGKLLIDLPDRTVELAPRQGFVVSTGVIHRTRGGTHGYRVKSRPVLGGLHHEYSLEKEAA